MDKLLWWWREPQNGESQGVACSVQQIGDVLFGQTSWPEMCAALWSLHQNVMLGSGSANHCAASSPSSCFCQLQQYQSQIPPLECNCFYSFSFYDPPYCSYWSPIPLILSHWSYPIDWYLVFCLNLSRDVVHKLFSKPLYDDLFFILKASLWSNCPIYLCHFWDEFDSLHFNLSCFWCTKCLLHSIYTLTLVLVFLKTK